MANPVPGTFRGLSDRAREVARVKSLTLQSEEDSLRLVLDGNCEREASMEVSVEVCSCGFSGRHSLVFFFDSDYSGFLEQLRELERTRRGKARIEAMSPEEFWLEILAVDRLGHIHAQGKLTQITTRRPHQLWSSLGFDIELDPTSLPKVVREFAEFRSRY